MCIVQTRGETYDAIKKEIQVKDKPNQNIHKTKRRLYTYEITWTSSSSVGTDIKINRHHHDHHHHPCCRSNVVHFQQSLQSETIVTFSYIASTFVLLLLLPLPLCDFIAVVVAVIWRNPSMSCIVKGIGKYMDDCVTAAAEASVVEPLVFNVAACFKPVPARHHPQHHHD